MTKLLAGALLGLTMLSGAAHAEAYGLSIDNKTDTIFALVFVSPQSDDSRGENTLGATILDAQDRVIIVCESDDSVVDVKLVDINGHDAETYAVDLKEVDTLTIC